MVPISSLTISNTYILMVVVYKYGTQKTYMVLIGPHYSLHGSQFYWDPIQSISHPYYSLKVKRNIILRAIYVFYTVLPSHPMMGFFQKLFYERYV